MLRYSYKVELKRTEMELSGLHLDLVRSQKKERKKIKEKIQAKEQQIQWLKDNQHLVPKPYIL